MNKNALLWPVILGVSRRQMPAANWVDIPRKSPEELLAFYRNTSIAHHRQQTMGDTSLDPAALAFGLALLYREILRRLIRAPAPGSAGSDDTAAAVVKEPPSTTKTQEALTRHVPAAKSSTQRPPARRRGLER